MNMKVLKAALAIWACAALVNSQSNSPLQNQYEIQQRIYFRDDQISKAPLGFGINGGNTNQQLDSYLQGLSSNANLDPNINNDGKQGVRLDLQPPSYESNSDFNYYAGASDRFIGPTNTRQQALPTLEVNNVSVALSNFGLNMLKNINQQSRNVVISPFSVAILLSLLQQGALGTTQDQISVALQMLPETSADAFKHIIEDFGKRSSRNILRVANNVYLADDFALSPAFKRTAQRNFGSEVTPIRFSNEDAVSKINRWVAERTNSQIPQLLPPDAVSQNTQLVLVNAIYFKGLWQVKFKTESTLSRPFNLNENQSKTVKFMRMQRYFRSDFDRITNAQFVILPFENNQYSLMVLLPSKKTNLNAVILSLTASQLAAYHNVTPTEVDLEIPKFTVRGDTDLTQIMKNMGITDVFGQKSELSGVGTYRTYSPQVSAALHTAMLSIDEEGGSAAAATAFAVVALSYSDPTVVFKADRPFLAILWDNQLSLPLFMARIEDPTL